MKVYNTLTRNKDEFVTREPGVVKMYVCGPTVYDYIHMGNARPIVVFDTVRRYLEYKGYKVNFVQNFTDIDDKIIRKSNEEGVEAHVISERFIEEALKDMNGLNAKPATKNPKATEEIEGMVEMIEELIQNGYAYAVDGTVYFRTNSYKEYGHLSKKNMDELEAGSRIAVSESKENPMDFVLWKPKKEGEPSWPSPWSEGRPGWHIECSVMAKKYLGDEIDIHAGGEDLVFPHHENEIAQSEAANGKEFSKYWMHNAFLNIENRKMSKSLGNFFTVREISEAYDLQVLRFFLLGAHYRTPLNFSREIMESSKNGLERIKTSIFNLRYLLENNLTVSLKSDEDSQEVERFVRRFEEAMDDDFNTSDAISIVFELVKHVNSTVDAHSSKEMIQKYLDTFDLLCDILGLVIKQEASLLDEEIEALIQQRQEARKNKDFAKADEIRNILLEKGILLEDTREGVRYKRA